jgi:antitoxin (DNA-binding transcriptional repressor) of toxin-antitoxin stability system
MACDCNSAKTRLSRLKDEAAAGKGSTIARAGKPVAKLMPLAPASAMGRRVLVGL